jgi:hypothetical protein
MLETDPHVSGLNITRSSLLDRAQELARLRGIKDPSSATLSLSHMETLVLIPTARLGFKLGPKLCIFMREFTLKIYIKLTGPLSGPRKRGRDKPRRHLDRKSSM